MNKSISAFVLGLIFSIIGAICAYLFWAVFVLVGAFSDGTIKTIITILPIINMATFALAFVGSIFCLIKKNVGGIILLVASIISLVCFATICIALKTFDIMIVLLLIPTILILISGLIALKKKKS